MSKKKDCSLYVPQDSKLKDKIEIREFKWTEKQQEFLKIALDKNTRIIICKSCPGVGKTLLSVFSCLTLLNNKAISKIIFYRNPIESASRSLGYLSGSYEDKISYYGTPLMEHLDALISKADIDKLFKEDRISIDSIGFAKGRTHHASGVILDESEDLTVQETRLIACRMGQFSKLFIIGDDRQADVKNSGFLKVFNAFNDAESREKGIYTFEFGPDDCMRSSILQFIIQKFENL